MKTLVFAVAGYNLAETGRMIEIARAARKHFNVIFASYGGQFEQLIEGEGFLLDRMAPRLTQERAILGTFSTFKLYITAAAC